MDIGFADDNVIPQWAKSSVEAARKEGIVSGRNGNQFVPNGTATRAEAIVILLNTLSKL
ncbi:S-layer homology domain-containing protein [Cohnella faecalis]|uniref:S-layer homology domain-containing protein n=1 Tax=Cohnella faecalis TaxID=2315694 RepID=A0A398CX36_9BACL|nr:S-layer homology domain-containing protein [Cohnella faecalis]